MVIHVLYEDDHINVAGNSNEPSDALKKRVVKKPVQEPSIPIEQIREAVKKVSDKRGKSND